MLFGHFLFFSYAFFEDVKSFEKEKGIFDTTMYTMIRYDDIIEILSSGCPEQSIIVGDQWFISIQNIITKKFLGKSDADILQYSWYLYEKLQKGHEVIESDTVGLERYCSLKYIVYKTQEFLRNKHISLLESSNIIGDFEDNDILRGWSIKRDVLIGQINALRPFVDKLGIQLVFHEKNPDFANDLDDNMKELRMYSKLLMKLTIYKSLYKLHNSGFFDNNDLNILKDVFVFEYVDDCRMINGRYEIKEIIVNGKHDSYETDALYLKVNVCPNFFILRDLGKTYEKIVIHELGHHFYYYHDIKTKDLFESICRNDSKTRNSDCKKDDFVSEYATTTASEDYAEHFMYRFLGYIPRDSKSNYIDYKNQYFSRKGKCINCK